MQTSEGHPGQRNLGQSDSEQDRKAEADSVQVGVRVSRPVSEGTSSQETDGGGLEEGYGREAPPVSLHQGWEDLQQGEGGLDFIIFLFELCRSIYCYSAQCMACAHDVRGSMGLYYIF